MCKMGVVSDPMAVVDSQVRLFGAAGLRAVDASTFPFAIPPNPQGTLYAMCREKRWHIISYMAIIKALVQFSC